MEFSELIQERRSIRAYQDVQIPHEDLEKILKEAQMSPTWKNLQAYKSYVVEQGALLEVFRQAALPAGNAKNSQYAALIVSTFVRDVVAYSDGKPVNEPGNLWGAYDLGLHDAYLILAAKNAGYDTLIMGIRNAAPIRDCLEIPENEEIMSVIAVGKRAQDPSMRPRKDLSEVASFH